MLRLALPFLVALSAVALVACGSDEPAKPVPLAQRFLTAEDAPGTKPDPVETRRTTTSLDGFTLALGDFAVDPDEEEVTEVFKDAGFKSGGVDLRFFGQTHAPTLPHVISTFVELGSEDGAKSALDWFDTDSKKPCPENCAFQVSTFDVDGIDGARGVRRVATAEDIKAVGTPDVRPLDRYWVGFTSGPVVYSVELHGAPGSVSEQQAVDIANAYHDRLTAD